MLDRTSKPRPHGLMTMAQAQGHLRRAEYDLEMYSNSVQNAIKRGEDTRTVSLLKLKVEGLKTRVAKRLAIVQAVENTPKYGVQHRKTSLTKNPPISQAQKERERKALGKPAKARVWVPSVGTAEHCRMAASGAHKLWEGRFLRAARDGDPLLAKNAVWWNKKYPELPGGVMPGLKLKGKSCRLTVEFWTWVHAELVRCAGNLDMREYHRRKNILDEVQRDLKNQSMRYLRLFKQEARRAKWPKYEAS